MRPNPLFRLKVTAASGCTPGRLPTPEIEGTSALCVPADGIPGTNGPVGTGGTDSFTSSGKFSGWGGNGAPETDTEPTVVVCRVADPGLAGGITIKRFTANPAVVVPT